MSVVPVHYDLTGDAHQLINTLESVDAKLESNSKEAATLTTRINALEGAGRKATTPGQGGVAKFETGLKGISPRLGEVAERVGKVTAAVGPMGAAVIAMTAAVVAGQAAIAKIVLNTSKWADELGGLSPLTKEQTALAKATSDAYEGLGTQAKIVGTRIGGQFADEVKEGVNALNGILTLADGAASSLLGLADDVAWLGKGFSYMTPAGNLAREALERLAEEGDEAQQALAVAEKLSATLKQLDEDDKARKDLARAKGREETGSADGVLKALQKEDAAREKGAKKQMDLEQERHAQFIENVQAEQEEARVNKKLGYEDEARAEEERTAWLEAQEKKKEAIEKITKAQEAAHDAQMARIQEEAAMVAAMAQQVGELIGNIAVALGGDEKDKNVAKGIGNVLAGIAGTAGNLLTGNIPGAINSGIGTVNQAIQDFPAGGMVRSYPTGAANMPPDHIPIAAAPGESVLNKAATARLGEVGVDALNHGRSMGGSSEVVVPYRHRVFNRFVTDAVRRPGALSRAFTGARRRGQRGR